MHSHGAFSIVGYEGETISHAVKARFATVGYLVFLMKMVFIAEICPIFLLCFGQNEDYVDILGILTKTLYGAHQHRFAAYWQELLGYVATHSQSLASCHYDDIFHSLIPLSP